jgi:hypothetical protein
MVYLSELLRQDVAAAELLWCFPDAIDDSQLSMESTLHDVRDDFFPKPTYERNDFREHIIPNRNGMQ